MLSRALEKTIKFIDNEVEADDGPWDTRDVIWLQSILKDMHEHCLTLEEELEGLRYMRDGLKKIAEAKGFKSRADKRREGFKVVAGTDTKLGEEPTCD